MKRFFAAVGHALRGLRSALARERHLRLHFVAAVAVVGFGFADGLESWEWVAITLCIAAVVMAELFNTALEHLADAVSPEKHPGVGTAKDMAAAGVLVAAVASVVVGLHVFF